MRLEDRLFQSAFAHLPVYTLRNAATGASVYDLTMHLNPLLPRRIVAE